MNGEDMIGRISHIGGDGQQYEAAFAGDEVCSV
jgi:hypothetical protein